MTKPKTDAPLTPAQRALVEGFLARWNPVAVLRAKYPGTYRAALAYGFDEEDVRQAAALAVSRAARRFDPRRGVKFSTYALPHVRGGVQAAIGRSAAAAAARDRTFSGDAPGRVEGREVWDELDLPDAGAGAAAAAEDAADLRAKLRAALRHLPPRHRVIVVLRFGLDGRRGLKLREIGRLLGVSHEAVRQVERRALDVLGGLLPAELARGARG